MNLRRGSGEHVNLELGSACNDHRVAPRRKGGTQPEANAASAARNEDGVAG